jgi:hypothetical protein
LQWLQDPSEINGNNLNNGRREVSRHFKNKKREYLKDKFNEFATNNKKNIRDLYKGLYEFKRCYQSQNHEVKDENAFLLADSQNILSRWKKYFFQLLNVHNVSDVRQIEVHMADQWTWSIIVPVHKKGDKTDCNNYCGKSLSTSYKILLDMLLSRLSPYTDEIIGDHQFGF